ncbi:MAG TPA: excinuclease ABC subunit UvrC [Anaerolineaceae bacterium]|nr:excinuclease ABC subunit UvrC [Anaerolineales bacterium]HOG59407.1 excinuclease ABC subunit UvrC [Anaerolineaceae bacterium]HOR84450.1 excinuclease ABC subunit UvrC [Anaerolineaceae bacterium]HPL43122.1 excinuclease ABC subunit UvrC [Anaerolineaceae bacterium]HQC20980.1 excinuclease ABC subunit UvrC [Anaerolineaceae bacterium]
MAISAHVNSILNTLPEKPGCYLMKDSAGTIIYVGKAINLKNRVRSYFHESADHAFKTRQMVKKIADIDIIVVNSELEALILEMNLIKEHRPFYNVRLKDDKRYPYIKIHWADDFPKLSITRQMVEDGSRYFGPYTSVWAVHQTLDILRKIFPYLTCAREITGKDPRPCLYYDIKLCSGPCIGAIDKNAYRQMIDDLSKFLEGKTDPVVKRLQSEMQSASENLNYERAAALRDQIQSIEHVVERQKIISDDQKDTDIVALARNKGDACVQIFFVRSGKLIGREYFILEGTEDEKNEVILREFIKQFYSQAAFIPNRVLLPAEVEEARIIKEWLNTRRAGEKIEIQVPKRGKNKSLVEMAEENAVETLKALQTRWKADKDRQHQALAELQAALNLPEPPNRIECYDISNTMGTASVGSMVVFEQGVANKKLYRRFNIRGVEGPDDFASMEEVLRRRFNHYHTAQSEKDLPGKTPDLSFSILPDLLIVDGGKGQLGRAVKVISEQGLDGRFKLVGLAKQEEELFLPGQSNSVRLEERSQGLYLIQRIRDEAHRFAITAHRSRRGKIGLTSRLDAIPGLGPARRKELILRFGSIEAILAAKPEEIAGIKGISLQLAQQIKAQLE